MLKPEKIIHSEFFQYFSFWPSAHCFQLYLKNDKVNVMTSFFFQKCSHAENTYVEDKPQSIENIIQDAC
jgi:hypothetical protein